MNYLAHIYLSGSSPQIRVGGFIADAVKGGIPEHYPYKLRSGIRLHRLIDNYTDHHPLVREMVALFKSGVRTLWRYSSRSFFRSLFSKRFRRLFLSFLVLFFPKILF